MSPVKSICTNAAEESSLSVRLKFISVSLLLCVALVCTVFAATGTIRAYQQFEQDHQGVLTGDVNTIRPWMTLPYIARVYHVPAPCFYQSLHITDPILRMHATLRTIADTQKEPVDTLLARVQMIIQGYRNHRQTCTVAPRRSKPPGSLTPRWQPGKGHLHE